VLGTPRPAGTALGGEPDLPGERDIEVTHEVGQVAQEAPQARGAGPADVPVVLELDDVAGMLEGASAAGSGDVATAAAGSHPPGRPDVRLRGRVRRDAIRCTGPRGGRRAAVAPARLLEAAGRAHGHADAPIVTAAVNRRATLRATRLLRWRTR
jgi:hypothetical protein